MKKINFLGFEDNFGLPIIQMIDIRLETKNLKKMVHLKNSKSNMTNLFLLIND